jgi:ACS family hexuronate transporter-like MFS transporter
MAHGLAHGWQGFAGLRGLLGLAEGSAHPAGMKTSAVWFPARERGFAAGLYNIGASFGSILAVQLVAFAIGAHWGWRSAFVIAGAAGLAWALLWLAFFQTPDRHKALSEREREHIVSGQEKSLDATGRRPPILSILKQRNFWGIALPRFLADPTWGTLNLWMPLYLISVRHLDLKQFALFGWLPFLAADLGCLFSPTVVLVLQRLGVRLVTARRMTFTLGALMMVGVAFTGFVQNPLVAVALLSLAGFAHQTLSITVITMASDLFKRSEVATVAGMAGTWGNFGILVFTLILGVGVTASGFAPFFVGLPVLDLIGAALLWALVREPKEQPA